MNENLKTDSPDNGAGYCVQSFRLNLETKLLWGHQPVEAGRQDKFYLADTALRYSVMGYTPDSVASSLENVVYLELCRRGYTVTIGKTPDGEVDFVAQK